jgi:alpha-amylase
MTIRHLWSALVLILVLGSTTGPAAAGPESLADEVFYHIMPIAWRDSDLDANRFGDFDGMATSLDYLDTLGITSIWMNPIFPSPAYHGYQHGAADQLNPWFGNEAQFTSFVESAHLRGIKVYVDLVAYGISQDTPWFTDSFGNPASAFDDWLAYDNASNTQFLGSNYTTWNGSAVGFIHWDLRNSAVSSLVTSWGQKWLDPNSDGDLSDGLDGFRLDHVWEFYPSGPNGWGYNIQDFWVPFGAALRTVNPDALLLAEQADWGTFGTQLFAGVDASFTKPFEFAARDALIQENASSLYSSVAASAASLSAATAPGTFLTTIGNHDVSRLATVIGDDFEKGKVAAALLLTQPFTPVLYYGDEIGMRGAKDNSLGGDASDIPMREPFKWNAVEGAPMSRYHQANAGAWANRISRDNDGRSVEEQQGAAGSLLEAYREMIALRRSRVALRRGTYAGVPASDGTIFAFARLDLTEQLVVVLNLSGAPRSFTLDLSGFEIPGAGSTTPTSALNGSVFPALTEVQLPAYSMSLAAYGYEILDLSLALKPPSPTAVDGQRIWGVSLAAQTTEVGAGLDNIFELDQVRARLEGGRLDLGLSGNLESGLGGLCLFYDLVPGGQNILDVTGVSPPPNGPELLGGTRFDPGFEPEGFLYINNFQGQLFVDQFFLADGGGATKIYRGMAIVGSGSGALTGGSNPNALEVALDNSNTAGVTSLSTIGADAVSTGLELSLSLADLGYDGTQATLLLSAALLLWDGTTTNQWLPGLGPGAADAGVAPDLRSFAGSQYATLDLSGGAVASPFESRWGMSVVGQDGSTRISFELPASGLAQLRVYDLRGRLVRRLLRRELGAGAHREEWDRRDGRGLNVAAGVYLLRLDFAGSVATAKTVVVN